MSDYSKRHDPWEDHPSTGTPILAADLDAIEEGIDTAHEEIAQEIIDRAAADTTLSTALATHLADPTDAHDAEAISFVPGGTLSSGNVQDAIEEVAAEAVAAGGISTGLFDNKGELIAATAADAVGLVTAATADDLVLTSDAAEATGMKWAAPDSGAAALVDLTDVSGGPPGTGEAPVWDGDSFEYTNVATQAELDTVEDAITDHVNDTSGAHDVSAINGAAGIALIIALG